MKYIYIVITLAILGFSLRGQSFSLFLKANDSGWYPEFLNPVVDTILNSRSHLYILDIGTGPGKLPELLIQKDSSLHVTGIDIDTSSIDTARRRIVHRNVNFEYQKINAPLIYKDAQYDIVTFCSVLFLLDDSSKLLLVQEALRVLKPGGKIVVLSPSGRKSVFSSLWEIWSYPYSNSNWTFTAWKAFTNSRGTRWQANGWLKQFSKRQQLEYSNHWVFNDNATLEIVIKP